MRRTLTALLIVTLALLWGTTGVAHAGGWAVVALDPLPASPVEGQAMAVGFTILQHGVTPYTTDNAFIVVTDATGRTERFTAKPAGASGHHIAQVTFPGSGVYRWEVQPDWFAKQSLGEITVENAAAVSLPPTSAANASDSSPVISAPSAPVATTTTVTTTTTVREPLTLALRITLAAALAVALAVGIADVVATRRRSLA